MTEDVVSIGAAAGAGRARVISPAFFLIAFGFSWTLWITMWLLTGRHAPGFKIAAMFGPALGCIVVRRWGSREGFKDVGAGLGLRWTYLVAWLSSPAIAALAMIAAAALGHASWGWNPHPQATGLDVVHAPGGLADAPTVGLQLLLDLTASVALAYPLVLGEDLGWAGYAIPKLAPRFGNAATLWLFALIWAGWHLPIHLMGHNNPDRSLVGLMAASVMIGAIGVFYAWLRIVSGSLWVPALFHASMNAASTVPFLFVTRASTDIWGAAVVVAHLVLAALATIHLARRRTPGDLEAIAPPRAK